MTTYDVSDKRLDEAKAKGDYLADLFCFHCGHKLEYISPMSDRKADNGVTLAMDSATEWYCPNCGVGYIVRSDAQSGHTDENPPKLIAVYRWWLEIADRYVPYYLGQDRLPTES